MQIALGVVGLLSGLWMFMSAFLWRRSDGEGALCVLAGYMGIMMGGFFLVSGLR